MEFGQRLAGRELDHIQDSEKYRVEIYGARLEDKLFYQAVLRSHQGGEQVVVHGTPCLQQHYNDVDQRELAFKGATLNLKEGVDAIRECFPELILPELQHPKESIVDLFYSTGSLHSSKTRDLTIQRTITGKHSYYQLEHKTSPVTKTFHYLALEGGMNPLAMVVSAEAGEVNVLVNNGVAHQFDPLYMAGLWTQGIEVYSKLGPHIDKKVQHLAHQTWQDNIWMRRHLASTQNAPRLVSSKVLQEMKSKLWMANE